MISWRVSVRGSDCLIEVSPGANGKYFVRVNGRVAGPPLGPNETERAFAIAGQGYVIRRSGESFELFPDEQPVVHVDDFVEEREPSRAPAVLAKIALACVALFAVYLAYSSLSAKQYENAARVRMQTLLQDILGGEAKEMAAIRTFIGRPPADLSELSSASDRFVQWCISRNLYRKTFTYQVTGAQIDRDAKVPTAIVTMRIDDVEYKARVPKRQPIEWEGPPPPQIASAAAPKEEKAVFKATVQTLANQIKQQDAPAGPQVVLARYKIRPSSSIWVTAKEGYWSPFGKAVATAGQQPFTYFAVDHSPEPGVTMFSLGTRTTMLEKYEFDVRLNNGGEVLRTGTYKVDASPADGTLAFDLRANGLVCGGRHGGTIDVLALEFAMGLPQNGVVPVYITRFDAKFKLQCWAESARPGSGEIHLTADLN